MKDVNNLCAFALVAGVFSVVAYLSGYKTVAGWLAFIAVASLTISWAIWKVWDTDQ